MKYSIYDNLYSLNEASSAKSTCSFFGTKKNVDIKDYYDNKKLYDENKAIVQKALSTFCSNKGLWDYLYTISEKWISEINNDPYFDGKKCTGGKDLIKAVKDGKDELDIFLVNKDGKIIVFVCGDYWLDDEHGFSVNFINGEVVKAAKGTKPSSSDYKNYTVLAGYDNAL